jgi:hypothetical protein
MLKVWNWRSNTLLLGSASKAEVISRIEEEQAAGGERAYLTLQGFRGETLEWSSDVGSNGKLAIHSRGHFRTVVARPGRVKRSYV